MSKTALSLASVAVLIIGVAVYFGIAGKERVGLSAQESAQNQAIIQINEQEFIAQTASTIAERTQGLSDRESLIAGTGMLFVFDPAENVSFWMYRMNFPLDMIFIRNSKVVAIERNVPAGDKTIDPDKLPRYSPNQPVSHVLELNAGEAEKIKVGDEVKIRNFNQI